MSMELWRNSNNYFYKFIIKELEVGFQENSKKIVELLQLCNTFLEIGICI